MAFLTFLIIIGTDSGVKDPDVKLNAMRYYVVRDGRKQQQYIARDENHFRKRFFSLLGPM